MIWSILYDYRGYTLSVTIPDALTIMTMYLTCFASLLIGAVFNRRKMEILITNFTAIDQILLQKNWNRIYRKTRLTLKLQLSLVIALLFGFYCYHIYVWAYGTSYIFLIAKDLANFSNIIMVIQYINVMQFLRHRFRILNQQLAASCDRRSHISDYDLAKHRCSMNHLKIRTTHPANTANIPIEMPIAQNYLLSEISMSMSYKRPDEVSRIHTLRQTCSNLYDITELVNEIYGYQITLELAYNFVSFVSYLYYALEVLSNVKRTGDRNQRGEESITLEVASSLCWVTLNLVRVLSITSSCFAASDEARRTATVVHKLLLRQTLPGDVSTELQLFSIQLLNNKVEFSAGGFFPVNLSLVYSMVGAATTYIIILLQVK
jgi:gustatory receptor